MFQRIIRRSRVVGLCLGLGALFLQIHMRPRKQTLLKHPSPKPKLRIPTLPLPLPLRTLIRLPRLRRGLLHQPPLKRATQPLLQILKLRRLLDLSSPIFPLPLRIPPRIRALALFPRFRRLPLVLFPLLLKRLNSRV